MIFEKLCGRSMRHCLNDSESSELVSCVSDPFAVDAFSRTERSAHGHDGFLIFGDPGHPPLTARGFSLLTSFFRKLLPLLHRGLSAQVYSEKGFHLFFLF